MSQSKKKRPDNRSAEKAPSSKAMAGERKWGWTGFVIASAVIAVILTIVGIFYYQNYVVPFNRTILTVDNIAVDMGYFLKRIRLAGVDSMTMLEALTNEQVIKLEAPGYGITISPEDIDQGLREIARGTSETISESEFQEWYRQQLNETGLSDSEYKEIAAIGLLAARLHEYLVERLPTVAEQVHLHAITVETYEDAQKTRARWEAGEDFADLAREVSVDEESRERGGDLGWLPHGVMRAGFDYVIFNLSPGEVSEPIPYVADPSSPKAIYYLFMVSEKADARELDDDSLQTLRGRALEDWLVTARGFHEVKWNFNSEINAWINWQLAKK